MATDYVTTPLSNLGKVVFCIGCGVLTFAIRSLTIGGVSFNSDSVGGKELSDQKLYTVSDFSTSQELSSYEKKTFSSDVAVWFTVMIMAVPVTVAGLGIFVCVKRKFK